MTTYRARQLPRHLGPAAWAAILGDAPRYDHLTEKRTADVVIVGAGFAGVSAARRMVQLQPDARVVVLEAGRVAEGAAGRNSGFMIDLPHDLASADYAGAGDDRALIDLNRRAIGFARDAVRDYQIRPDYFDEAGKVNGAASEVALAHNASYAAHLAGLGEASEILDAQAMQELTGSSYYLGGLYTAGTVMLQPAGYMRGMAAGLAEVVALYEDSPVTALTRAGPDWVVETPAGQVTAGAVILATNGHLESFGFARAKLMHVFLYASMTPELDPAQVGGADRWGITPSDPMGTTIRRIDAGQGGNRIVTRTCATLRSGMAAKDSDLRRAVAVQRRKFDARFPQLAGLAPAYEWAGHLCLTRNGVSVSGELEPGLFAACVQNGLGTTRGTLTGMAAAERVVGVASDMTRFFDAEAAPLPLPPQPFRDVGANIYLRWKERQARRE